MNAMHKLRQAVFVMAFAMLACVTTLISCKPTESPPEAEVGSRPRVAIIALDGLEPSLLNRLLEAGRLPNFRRLIENGSQATIDCVVGTTSPVVWTTVATGVSPERHGVTGFTIDDVPVTSTVRRVPALWNILPRYDISSATLGWLVTWPAESDSGIVISDRSHWGKFESKISPAGIIDLDQYQAGKQRFDLSFLPYFTTYPYDAEYETIARDDPRYAVNFLIDRRLKSIHIRDTIYSRITQEILKEKPVDVLATYFQGIDYVSHGFWKYYEPTPFRKEGWEIDDDEVETLKGVIPKYYIYIDKVIGEVVANVGNDALIMVLSDHGFGTGLGRYKIKGGDFLSGNHRFTAALILSGPQIQKGLQQTRQITHFDVLPTILAALGLPLSRDHEGSPLLHYFTDSFLSSLKLSFVDTYGSSPIEENSVKESEHDSEISDELRSLGYIE